MSNFLELCRDLERESGTVSPSSLIQNVATATNRSAKTVGWVREAWSIIQNDRTDWLFLRKDFADLPMTIGTGRYAPSALGFTDHAAWIPDNADYFALSIRDSTASVRDDSDLIEIDYQAWRRAFARGQEPGRPLYWAASPSGELCLGPVPDKAYLLTGEYRRTAQVLTANIDVPILPTDHHQTIVWRALMLLAGHDEGGALSLTHAAGNFASRYAALVNAQTPRIWISRGLG